MRLTVGGVIAAGAALLFVAALGYVTRAPLQNGSSPSNGPAIATSLSADSRTVSSQGAAAGIQAAGASAQTGGPTAFRQAGAPSASGQAGPQAGQPKMVSVGLSSHRHHDGHERE
jgi:hypothetical protein